MSSVPTGDRGQRYEVRAAGYPNGGENVIGWASLLPVANRMADSIFKAPNCTDAWVLDRQTGRRV